ncbi:MAG: hypothetical protein R1F54_05155 [Candidatus Zeuxoniibacter abyssi]|nr:MAG: hypothetical protein R1F54_05155 [Candidatus Persebacteraceae bacterium AB1(2)]
MDDFLLIDEEPKKWLTAFQSLADNVGVFCFIGVEFKLEYS